MQVLTVLTLKLMPRAANQRISVVVFSPAVWRINKAFKWRPLCARDNDGSCGAIWDRYFRYRAAVQWQLRAKVCLFTCCRWLIDRQTASTSDILGASVATTRFQWWCTRDRIVNKTALLKRWKCGECRRSAISLVVVILVLTYFHPRTFWSLFWNFPTCCQRLFPNTHHRNVRSREHGRRGAAGEFGETRDWSSLDELSPVSNAHCSKHTYTISARFPRRRSFEGACSSPISNLCLRCLSEPFPRGIRRDAFDVSDRNGFATQPLSRARSRSPMKRYLISLKYANCQPPLSFSFFLCLCLSLSFSLPLPVTRLFTSRCAFDFIKRRSRSPRHAL